MNLILKQSILSFGRFLLLAALLSACGSARQTQERIIFFSSNKQGGIYITSVYSVNLDGSGLAHLVEVPAIQAVLSPDGQKLAYRSSDSLDNYIYVVNMDGSNQKQMPNPKYGSVSSDPVWSPDGQRIAFTALYGMDNTIYTINVDGSGLKPLGSGGLMVWSPDGQKIAFNHSAGERSSSGIKVVDSDGGNPRDLTDPKDSHFCESYKDCPGSGIPVWSPDSSKIAFVSNLGGKPGIYVVDSDGSKRTQIAVLLDDDPDRSPGHTWSPDGKRIAFVSKREGNFNIYVAMADGSHEVRLTDNTSHSIHPSWSPDGRKIVFASNRDGNWKIYILTADGSNQTRLTNNDTDNYRKPIWQPQPKP